MPIIDIRNYFKLNLFKDSDKFWWMSHPDKPNIYWLHDDSDMFDMIVFEECWKNYNIDEMKTWCYNNCKNKVGFSAYNTWIFENINDMIFFKLRWY